ncbi:MAG: T9SS type A sorting domain-containing protein [Bacteroidetes bacterium]|nr:T9SS type A sorting domain-containing protein [Bacteroidota bacterium]
MLFLEIHDEPLTSSLRKGIIKKRTELSVLSAYPNPTSDFARIILNNLPYKGRILLYDAKSQLSIDREINNGMLDLKSLTQGIYIVKVIDEEGSYLQCKLVIIR